MRESNGCINIEEHIMIVKELINKLFQYVREDENCSYPVILLNENKIELAIFTYFDDGDTPPSTVYGYGQFIRTDGENVETVELDLFQNEDEFIFIDLPLISIETYNTMYEDYFSQLQIAVDSLKANGVVENVDDLRNAFKTIAPTEVIELYRRICPSFLELIKVE